MDAKMQMINRIWDRYFCASMSVRIIGKHNTWGEINHYIIQKKINGRLHKRQTVKIHDQYGNYVDLKFETKDEALERLDKKPVDEILVDDEMDFIIS